MASYKPFALSSIIVNICAFRVWLIALHWNDVFIAHAHVKL